MDALKKLIVFELSIKANIKVLPYNATSKIIPIDASIRFVFFIIFNHPLSRISIYYSKEKRKL